MKDEQFEALMAVLGSIAGDLKKIANPPVVISQRSDPIEDKQGKILHWTEISWMGNEGHPGRR